MLEPLYQATREYAQVQNVRRIQGAQHNIQHNTPQHNTLISNHTVLDRGSVNYRVGAEAPMPCPSSNEWFKLIGQASNIIKYYLNMSETLQFCFS